MLRTIQKGLVLDIFWYDLSNGKGTRDFVHGIASSLTTAAQELARYKLDLVGVQEVSWDKGGKVRAGDYDFSYGKGNKHHQDCLYTTEQYQLLREQSLLVVGCHIQVLRGRWHNIIVLNVNAPSEEKRDDSKDSFYGLLEQVFRLFS